MGRDGSLVIQISITGIDGSITMQIGTPWCTRRNHHARRPGVGYPKTIELFDMSFCGTLLWAQQTRYIAAGISEDHG